MMEGRRRKDDEGREIKGERSREGDQGRKMTNGRWKEDEGREMKENDEGRGEGRREVKEGRSRPGRKEGGSLK